MYIRESAMLWHVYIGFDDKEGKTIAEAGGMIHQNNSINKRNTLYGMAYTCVDMITLFWIDSPTAICINFETIYNKHCNKIENWYLTKLFSVSYFTSILQVIDGEGRDSGFDLVYVSGIIRQVVYFVLTKDVTIYTSIDCLSSLGYTNVQDVPNDIM